ncbi:piwi-like protein Ago3 isoform X2 [Trichogramma pretiosum]|nr:piwi-like protein Ago3 isoform X2 [Trichogramma pretiosum]
MAEGGRGLGRGNLLNLLKKKKLEEQKAKEEEAKEQEKLEEEKKSLQQGSEESPKVFVSRSLGRGGLLEKLKKRATTSDSDSSPVASTTASLTSTATISTSTIAQGRGSIALGLKKKTSLETSGETSGVLGKLSSLSMEESAASEPEVVSRHGESGKKIPLSANFIDVKVDKSKGMFQYEVKFSPDIDSRNLRFKLLNQHTNELGNVKTFDGALLYLPVKLPEDITLLNSIHPIDNSTVALKIIFKQKQAMKDNISFFNTLMNRVMEALTLVRIGRNVFHPEAAHQVPQHRLEVWPGYITSINEFEGGLKLNLDAIHRVMRLDTVRDLMTDMYKRNPNDFKKAVANEMIGASVLTRYNNRTYKIDDIDWSSNPTLKFQKGEQEMSLVDYYKQHYNIEIKDLKQPLLVHRAKEKAQNGETVERICLLIPELCFLAGMTDSIRNDFTITKDLSNITKVSPDHRRQIIKKFIEQVNGNENVKKILSNWGLELESNIIDFQGRVLESEEIMFGNNYSTRSDNADWGKAATSSKVLRTPNMQKWAIICTQRNKRNCDDFVETLKGICQKINIRIGEPITNFLRDDNLETYVSKLREILSKNTLEMVVIIFPTMRQDKYSAVKKICCVELPVPSQVIISRTISKPDKLRSVVAKIALQMNCKLGGALWALKNPFANAMICGIDVHHAGIGHGSRGSVAAFVASLDRLLTTWHSRVCMQGQNQELIDLLKQCLLSSIKVYKERNGQFPDKIFIYRDGVGDGQLDMVMRYEVKQFLQTCSMIDPAYKPKLSVIIVQKRVNTRIFEKKRGGNLENPPPGTMVDTNITRRHLYDFYLVPQVVRQGTVTPTHYIVLHDGAEVKTDHMQRFTFKLCHLYYNWPGTIRVPAPCQYAHKLAYLVGQSVKLEPHADLNNLLYYL